MFHQRVTMVFEEHERWLKEAGGNMALEAVQRANLIAIMDKHFKECEVRAHTQMQLRLNEGARKIGKLGMLVAIIQASIDGDKQNPVTERQAKGQPQRPQPIEDGQQKNDDGGADDKNH